MASAMAVSLPAVPRGVAALVTVAALGGMLVIVGSPAAGQGSPSAPQGGTINYAERPGVGSWNPYASIYMTGPTDRVLSMIYEPLFRFNFAKDDWENVLATGFVAEVPRQGGASAYAVNLKANVQWHDLTAFTANDVIFTYWEYIRKAAVNKQQRDMYSSLLVDVRPGKSPLQVVFEFRRNVPDPRFFLSEFIIPAARFTKPTLTPISMEKDLAQDPMGTGPYAFERKSQGLPYLTRWKNYHGKPGNLLHIGGIEYVDQSQMVADLLMAGGRVNLAVEVPPPMLQRIESSGLADFGQVPSYNVFAIALRQKPGSVLNDERVRVAMTMAVNRDQLLANWFGNKGQVVASPVVRQAPYYDSELKPLKFDSSQAKRDIRALVPAGTKPLVFIYPSAEYGLDTHISDMAISVKQALEAVGLKIDLQGKKTGYFEQVLSTGEFDLALVRWEFNPAYDIRPLFHSTNSKPGGLNYMNFKDDQVDRWLDAYESASDEALKQNLMKSLQKRIAAKAPAMFLVSEEKVYAYHKTLSIPPNTVDPYYFFTYAGLWWQTRP